MTLLHPSEIFTQAHSEVYDARNSRLASIQDNLHALMKLILKDLPPQSRLLCVGAGTGAEMISLAKSFPYWRFVGLDPAPAMLEVCQKRLTEEHLSGRCQLVHGYIDAIPADDQFDAVISILVGHFVPKPERLAFYQSMAQRLRPQGQLIMAEISYDLASKAFPAMLKNWEGLQSQLGSTPDSLTNLAHTLQNTLAVLSPEDVEKLLSQADMNPVRFFQSFMITGWHSLKHS